MGIIISRFRKKQTTTQILENLEKKIHSIEEFQKVTQQQQRVVVGKLVLYSLTVYFIVIIIYYYYFTPASIRENITYFVPLLIYPLVIFASKKLITWYYKRQIEKNEDTLSELKSTKKKVLEEVMDKETYKTAKEILEKYAPEQLFKNVPVSSKAFRPTSAPIGPNGALPALPAPSSNSQLVLRKASPISRRLQDTFDAPYQPVLATPQSQHSQPKIPFVRPILPQYRGPFEKLVDMLIGDGPNNRYALICKTCSSHNGMALKHEFEYLAFRCAYCLQFNPARKRKPHAPNILQDETALEEVDSDTDGDYHEEVKHVDETSTVEGSVEYASYELDETTEKTETEHLGTVSEDQSTSDSIDELCEKVNKAHLNDSNEDSCTSTTHEMSVDNEELKINDSGNEKQRIESLESS